MSGKNIFEDENLSFFKDPNENDIEQEELNIDLLLSHDRQNFYDTIHERTNRAAFIFILNKISVNTIPFDQWEKLFLKLNKYYGLNYLIPYMDIYRHNSSISDVLLDIVEFLRFLKIDLISDIIDGIINKDTDYETFIDYINSKKKCPSIMIDCIKYMDSKSYNKFIKKIHEEANE